MITHSLAIFPTCCTILDDKSFKTDFGLNIIQYLSISLDWKCGNVVLNQKVDPIVYWDPYLRMTSLAFYSMQVLSAFRYSWI